MIARSHSENSFKFDPLILAVAGQFNMDVHMERYLLNAFAEQMNDNPDYTCFIIHSPKEIQVGDIGYTGFFLLRTHKKYLWCQMPIKPLGSNYAVAYIRLFQIFTARTIQI